MYAGCVVLLQEPFRALTGRSPSLSSWPPPWPSPRCSTLCAAQCFEIARDLKTDKKGIPKHLLRMMVLANGVKNDFHFTGVPAW
jgi:hypothetical protein